MRKSKVISTKKSLNKIIRKVKNLETVGVDENMTLIRKHDVLMILKDCNCSELDKPLTRKP